MSIVQCIVCGIPFRRTQSQKTCSSTCWRERDLALERQYRERNSDQKRLFYKANRERIIKRRRELDNEQKREAARQRTRAWAKANPDQRFATWRKYYLRNRHKLIEYQGRYKALNEEKIRKRYLDNYARGRAAVSVWRSAVGPINMNKWNVIKRIMRQLGETNGHAGT